MRGLIGRRSSGASPGLDEDKGAAREGSASCRVFDDKLLLKTLSNLSALRAARKCRCRLQTTEARLGASFSKRNVERRVHASVQLIGSRQNPTADVLAS